MLWLDPHIKVYIGKSVGDRKGWENDRAIWQDVHESIYEGEIVGDKNEC